eukprot:6271957-Prorocentrum_lima.AAC.1
MPLDSAPFVVVCGGTALAHIALASVLEVFATGDLGLTAARVDDAIWLASTFQRSSVFNAAG